MSSWFSATWEFVRSVIADVDWQAVPAFLGRKIVERRDSFRPLQLL